MVKASILDNCIDLTCPGLKDLIQQTSSASNDPVISFYRSIIWTAVISQFQILYSFLINSFHQLGLDWVSSYNLGQLLGVLIIALGLATFLHALFGNVPSGIALIFLSVSYLPTYGLTLPVPGNISLGIAMLSWGLIIKRTTWMGVWLPSLVFLTCGMHDIGKAWSVITFLLLAGCFKWPPSSKEFKTILSTVVVFLIFLFYPFFLDNLAFKGFGFIKPEQLNYVRVIKENINEAIFITGRTMLFVGGVGLSLVISFAGFLHLSPHKRKSGVILLVSLLGLCIVSLFFILPFYPANIFYRMIAPLWVLIVGAVSYTACKGLPRLWKFRKTIFGFREELSHSTNFLSSQGWTILGYFISVLILSGAVGSILLESYVMARNLKNIIKTSDFTFNKNQPNIVLQGQPKCGTVAYNFYPGLYYYLMQGATKCGALYLPAILNSPEAIILEQRRNDITHSVFRNPIKSYKNRILVSSKQDVVFNLLHQGSNGTLRVLIENSNRKTDIIIGFGKGKEKLITLDPFYREWIDLTDIALKDSKEITIRVARQSGHVFVSGVRIFSDSKIDSKELLWPWGQGVVISYYSLREELFLLENGYEAKRLNNNRTTINFNAKEFAGLEGFNYEVLDDAGITILAKVSP